MPPLPHVHFLLDPRATRFADIEAIDEGEIERAPARFQGGRNSWIAQGYLRLRPSLEAMGCRVSAGPGFRPGAIVVAHRDDVNRFGLDAHRSFLVVVRADRAPVHACDLAIVQNGASVGANERFVPLWPQPGLVRRDARRARRLAVLAYQGRAGRLPWWTGERAFHEALAARGVRFEVRESGWHRYDDVDLVLAARDDAPAMLATKPATKLYNGWHAGVPVLAGPEPAYRALRASPLDFLEVRGPGDVVAAVGLLATDPALYQAMALHGLRRARDYSVEAIRAWWLRTFVDDVLPAWSHRATEGRRRWFWMAMARQKLASRAFRGQVALGRAGFAGYSGSTARTSAPSMRPPTTASDVIAAGVAARWWTRST